VRRNMVAIFRIYTGYEPLRVFTTIALVLFALGMAAWSPFLYDWVVNGESDGHLQSLVLGAVFVLSAVQVFVLGVIADTVSAHRTISQRTLERVRRVELVVGVEPSNYDEPDPRA